MRQLFSTKVRIILVAALLLTAGLAVLANTGTQILTLKHEAQDRSLFAEGALAAAAFLIGKQPGLYTMDDIVE